MLLQVDADRIHEGIDNLSMIGKKPGEDVWRGDNRFSFTVRQVRKVKKTLIRL